ncbi:MAG: indole-3-glycerol phosphate synthase TrpC [Nostoc sp. ZfuVER08]|jgi:indole-3-glycerol phosphate synthase|uniref:Indole-3-glycerol phosphate synthase n=1 Tax=Nostoc punctiforme FACHB-252 TaxID=1357509 RepID=A0ABR8HI28_NOSPU|nr:indole-3-glycerol phosphate synthase TrpC [Nostoc punctiforme]MBD2614879.1 indole-3-glycerol phosphate synthase TrpC [Nostoc punctiforme FACHB-252]MBL1199182.1 indole-3-glycerol phosphate synthase TrpC [Nostoc sp. GBBB01]MDZ8014504.1 indole-3-glycerol phosphate synthase TrpC [Nostoc sp. ZfuVER08]
MTYPFTTTHNTHLLQPTLKEIVWQKKYEVAQIQQEMSLASLQRQLTAAPTVRDFLSALQQSHYRPCIIAEVKKASLIHGIIKQDLDPVAIAKAYERGGATCISVVTDHKFFHGSFETLRIIRHRVTLPLLCKDFILDPCQIYLARAAGADAVLLIASILSDRQLQNFLRVIHYLGMNALVEVRTLAELDRVLKLDDVRLIGINNQSLEDFSIDINTTGQLLAARRSQIQSLGISIVSESGLYTPADLSFVSEAGTHAVLLGDSLIKQDDVQQAVRNLLQLNLSNHNNFLKKAIKERLF